MKYKQAKVARQNTQRRRKSKQRPRGNYLGARAAGRVLPFGASERAGDWVMSSPEQRVMSWSHSTQRGFGRVAGRSPTLASSAICVQQRAGKRLTSREIWIRHAKRAALRVPRASQPGVAEVPARRRRPRSSQRGAMCYAERRCAFAPPATLAPLATFSIS